MHALVLVVWDQTSSLDSWNLQEYTSPGIKGSDDTVEISGDSIIETPIKSNPSGKIKMKAIKHRSPSTVCLLRHCQRVRLTRMNILNRLDQAGKVPPDRYSNLHPLLCPDAWMSYTWLGTRTATWIQSSIIPANELSQLRDSRSILTKVQCTLSGCYACTTITRMPPRLSCDPRSQNQPHVGETL